MNQTVWIIFEGIDSSGKTTQAKMLNEFLCGKGIKSAYRHIFDSNAGRILRDVFINNSFGNTVEILLLCATRQAFLDEIDKERKNYDVIILDRYFLSIYAMQGKNESDIDLITYLKKFICKKNDILYTFFIDTAPDVCAKRLKQKSCCDRIEMRGLKFHTQVYDRYLMLLEKEKNVTIFDGSKDIILLHQEIIYRTLSIIKYIFGT